MDHLLAKICLSAGTVIAITLIAERVSVRFAGVLLGFPLGSGLSLYFLGLEQGARFAADSALWTIQGLIAALVFCRAYLAGTRRWSGPGITNILACCALGLLGFAGAAFLVHSLLPPYLWFRLTLVALVLLVAATDFRQTAGSGIRRKIKVTPQILAGRAGFAALVVITVTWAGSVVGPQWSGLMAAFPMAILPSIVVLHHHYGTSAVGPLLRELPQGMLAIILFATVIRYVFPLYGVHGGICIAYLVATVYLLIYERWLRGAFNRLFDRTASLLGRG